MDPEPLRAALAVAAGQGLPVDRPRVVRDLTNLLVHLEPAPVVARVPLTLSRLRGPDWFATELELAAFLELRGAPVAPPARDVDPGPHAADGYAISLWAWLDHDLARFDPAAAGHSLRELHDALARYPGALPSFDRLDEVGTLLRSLEPSRVASSEDLERLRAAHAELARRPRPSGGPLHGDAHFRNVLWTPEGPRWSDLENACRGPVEFDLACIAWRGAPGTGEALAAYGRHDPELLEAVTPFLALFLAAWTIVVAERMPTPDAVAEARRRIERATRG
jgi:Ser/Thr protein kinase RdoA (MazF antagonist)